MAQRRMFSRKITESDAFVDMPLSSQCLYFHIAMAADDDGFVEGVNRIRRSIGASEDDLKLLFAKTFLIPFESGVVVVRQWHVHNYIQKDRYTPTTHAEEMKRLTILETGEKGAYALVYEQREIPVNTGANRPVHVMDTKCIQDVSAGKVRDRDRDRDRVRLDQSKVNPYEDDEEDEEEQEARARARVREEALTAWRYYFGKDPTPATLDRICRVVLMCGFDDGVITIAIMVAAQREPSSPADYLFSILTDWKRNKVKSTADADEYMFLYDASIGKLKDDGVLPHVGSEGIKKFREDRETDAERRSRLEREAKREEDRKKRVAMIEANKAKREAEEQAAAAAKAASADY